MYNLCRCLQLASVVLSEHHSFIHSAEHHHHGVAGDHTQGVPEKIAQNLPCN